MEKVYTIEKEAKLQAEYSAICAELVHLRNEYNNTVFADDLIKINNERIRVAKMEAEKYEEIQKLKQEKLFF